MQTTKSKYRQHGEFFYDLIREGVHGDKLVIYSLIYDRMKSSVIRDAFYDKYVKRHYVIYTVKELAEFIQISERTVGKFIKQLVEDGYLKIKKQFSKANKIFIPDFDEEESIQEYYKRNNDSTIAEDNSVPYTKNVPTNQINNNQNKHFDTVNTNKGQKSQKNKVVEDLNVSFESWIKSTAFGYSMDPIVPQTVAKYARHFENPMDLAYKIIGTVSTVRAFIAKKFNISKTELSQFDSNANFGYKLADKIKSVMIHAIAKKINDIDNLLAYLNTSLQEFFTHATGKGFQIARPGFSPEMSDERIDPHAHQQPKKRKAVVPQWLKDQDNGIKPKSNAPTIFKAIRVKAIIKKFDQDCNYDYDIDTVIIPKIKELMDKYSISLDTKVPDKKDNPELFKIYNEIQDEILSM